MRWQALRLIEEEVEQVAHDALGFAGHAVDFVMAVHVGHQEFLEVAIGFLHGGREGDDGLAEAADVVHRFDMLDIDVLAGIDDQIRHHAIDEAADGFVDQALFADFGIARPYLAENPAYAFDLADLLDGEQPGAQAVVDVVVVVGDVVGERCDLRFGAGEGFELQVVLSVIFDNGARQCVALDAVQEFIDDAGGCALDQRAVVFGDAFERFPSQVQAVKIGVAMFEVGDQAQRVGVVIEAAERLHAFGQRVFAGMAERRVAEIVRERQRFGEVFMQAQRAADGAGELRDFETVREARAVMVAFVVDEHLRFIFETAEGGGMDDAIAVALEGGAGVAFFLAVQPAAAMRGIAGVGGELAGIVVEGGECGHG